MKEELSALPRQGEQPKAGFQDRDTDKVARLHETWARKGEREKTIFG